MTCHLVNFYSMIAQVLKDEKLMDQSQILLPVIPSKEINFLRLKDQQSVLDYLELDRAISKDAFYWKTNSSISLSQRYQQFLEDTVKESVESIDNLDSVEGQLQQSQANIFQLKSQLLEKEKKLENKKKDQEQLDQLEIEKSDLQREIENSEMNFKLFIKQNYYLLATSNIINIDQMKFENGDCYDVKFQPIGWQKMLELDQLKFERKISYNSDSQNLIPNQNIQQHENLKDLLKGFGLGDFIKDNLAEIPIDYCFDSLIIEADFQSISVDRYWIHTHLLYAEPEKNFQKFQKSFIQDVPFVATDFIIVKNLVIKGFKKSELIKFLFKQLRENSENSYALQFKMKPEFQKNDVSYQSYEISQDDDNLFIKINYPQIISYVISSTSKLFYNEFNKFQMHKNYQSSLDLQNSLKIEEETKSDENQKQIDYESPNLSLDQISFTINDNDDATNEQIFEETKQDLKSYLPFMSQDDIIVFYEEQKENKQFCKIKKSWKDLLVTFIEEIKNSLPDDGLSDVLPKFSSYEQKSVLLSKLKEDKVRDNIPVPVLNKIYLGMKQEDINFYKFYFKKHKIITNRIEDLYEEEKNQCLTFFRNNQLDFNQIMEKTYIHPSVIEQIYNQRLDKILEQKQLLEILQKNIKNLQDRSKEEISDLLFKEDKTMKENLKEIFKNSINDYKIIKNICLKNEVTKYLLQNEIEEFYRNIKLENFNECNKYIRVQNYSDSILCFKLFYNLLSDSGISQNQQKNEHFQNLQLHRNKNLARVISKAYLLSLNVNQDEAFQKQQDFEQRMLFHDVKNSDVHSFMKKCLRFYKSKDNDGKQIKDLIDKNKDILKVQSEDYEYIMQYIKEYEEYKNIIKEIGKNFEEQYDDNNDQIQIQDITKVANFYKKNIVLNNIQENQKYSFGEKKEENPDNYDLFISDDQFNQTFQIQKKIVLKIQTEAQDSEIFKKQYYQLYDPLPQWMKTFFGFQNLFRFIYDEKKEEYIENNILILDDLSKQYEQYEGNPNDENFRIMQEYCINLQNADQQIFFEWLNVIQKKSVSGQQFLEQYEFQKARSNISQMVKHQKVIKQIFPDPGKILTLKEFNKMTGRIDKNQQQLNLSENLENQNDFVHYIIQQMFGFFNRRENLSAFVADLKILNLQVQISTRFLLSLLLQSSDVNLRQRIIQYQSEYYSVPLIMQCQKSFESETCRLRYVPEVLFIMQEGSGVLNIGCGARCIQQCGKSQLINDLLFPITTDFSHEAFEQQDKNIFSVSHVDVFFEKSFDKKRDFVMMDAQGKIKTQALESALELTNLIIINFNRQDINTEHFKDLEQKIDLISSKQNQNIHIMLLIRDSLKTGFVSKDSLKENYKPLQEIIDKIDFCFEIISLNNKKKNDRLIEMKQIFCYFYEKIDEMKKFQHQFTKKNFQEKFIKNHILTEEILLQYKDQGDFQIQENQNPEQKKKNTLTADQKNSLIVLYVTQKTEEFMKEINEIKDNIFQEKGLQILDIKRQIRDKVLDLRRCTSGIEDQTQVSEDQLNQEINQLQNILRKIQPSKILQDFYKIIVDPNHQLLQIEIAKKIKDLSNQQIQNPKQKITDIIKKQSKSAKKGNPSKDEIDIRMNKYKQKMDLIKLEIQQKTFSIEYFWRSLVFFLGNETDCNIKDENENLIKWLDVEQKKEINMSIDKQLKNGDCFELIDGENLEFKGKFIKGAIKSSKSDKVVVVCVIGPQSSGKSTLMNSALGAQFSTGSGRCTVGIYFTLQRFPDDSINKGGVKWLLLLDTEGLQSPERIDDEYDRKIVLFAMLSADILIINNKGEINSKMINTLKMCCITIDKINQTSKNPEIYYIFGQNDDKDKNPLKRQVQDLKSKVISASLSKTIEKTAEAILGYNEDKIYVLGVAYKREAIEKDDSKGLKFDNSFKVGITNFGVESSQIFQIIMKHVNDPTKKFQEISYWLDESRSNWKTIDKYTNIICNFKDIEDLFNDEKVQVFFYKKWEDYIKQFKVRENDKIKSIDIIKKLKKGLNLLGEQKLKNDLKKVEEENDREKDLLFEQNIMIPYQHWKDCPQQKGITLESEKKYKSKIKAENEVIKTDFMVIINDKMKEELMKYINKNGHKNIQICAMQISKDQSYQKMSEQEKQQYLDQQFEEKWIEAVNEIKSQSKIDQMKRTYFDNILKTFLLFNNFIQFIGDSSYKHYLDKVEKEYASSKFKDSRCLEKFISQELKIPSSNNEQENKVHKKLFKFNDEMLFQMHEDPKIRIFNSQHEENFFKVKDMINCNFTYSVKVNPEKWLNVEFLKRDMLKNLTLKKEVEKEIIKYNFYGKKFIEKEIMYIEDLDSQKSYLYLLLSDLDRAGYKYFTKDFFKKQIMSKMPIDQLDSLFQEAKKNSQQWIIKFLGNIVFDKENEKSSKYTIHERIKDYFTSEKVEIQGRQDPNEQLGQHMQLDQGIILRDAYFISEPIIEYYANPKCGVSNSIVDYLIQPKEKESPVVQKYDNLSQIALKRLQWGKIAEHIIKSVQIVLRIDNQEQQQNEKNQIQENNSEDDLDLNQIKEIYQISYDQIKTLESLHLNTRLRELINVELNTKTCLYLDPQTSAKISFCAMIACWVEIYKKAEQASNKHIEQFEKQKQKQYETFKQIIKGEKEKITQENSKNIIIESNKLFVENLKIDYKNKIIQEIENQKSDFETLRVYQRIDQIYLQTSHEKEIPYFIEYVENPVKIFENEVKQMLKDKIYFYINVKSQEIKIQMRENITLLRNLLVKLKNHGEQMNQHQAMQIENYFNIYEDEDMKNPLSFDQKSEISNTLSPIVYDVLSKILQGTFDVKEKYKSSNFIIISKNGLENGPLQCFDDKEIKTYVKAILDKKQQAQLLRLIIENLDLKQNEDDQQIFNIDVAIQSMITQADKLLEDIDKYDEKPEEIKKDQPEKLPKNIDNEEEEKNQIIENKTIKEEKKPVQNKQIEVQSKHFDKRWFECVDEIENLMRQAIGCETMCIFCNRKCELPLHGKDVKHNCDTVGHQMRVFKGGHFIRENRLYPSLNTCDFIDPETCIFIDGIKNKWQQILNVQMIEWKVSYKQKELESDLTGELKKRQFIFNDFWKKVGKYYCDNMKPTKYTFIEKIDEIEENRRIHESGIIVIALDESGSMGGMKWRNAVNGSKRLIQYIKDHHSDHKLIQLVLIQFDDEPHMKHDGPIDEPITSEDVWKANYGGTCFGPAIQLVFEKLYEHIQKKDFAKLFFFTDGTSGFPQAEFNNIREYFELNHQQFRQNQRNKLDILLMCENENNKTMQRMHQEFNDISRRHFGELDNTKLIENVETDQIGDHMIQSFENFNLGINNQ